MKKIIDVGPPTGGVNWGLFDYLSRAAECLRPRGYAAMARILEEYRDRAQDAPEVTDTTVLIDTADDERIRELHVALRRRGMFVKCSLTEARDRIRAALREIDKPPIEEPVLFGAIVRNVDNYEYVRTVGPVAGRGGKFWHRGGASFEFAALDAKEIVSPGIDQTIDQAI